jgi:hypothetical protein
MKSYSKTSATSSHFSIISQHEENWLKKKPTYQQRAAMVVLLLRIKPHEVPGVQSPMQTS